MGLTLCGLYAQIIVVLGFPKSSITSTLGEIDSILIILSQVFGDRRKPIPPVEAFVEFFVADDVRSIKDSIWWYLRSVFGW